jgi:ribosomal protein L21E
MRAGSLRRYSDRSTPRWVTTIFAGSTPKSSAISRFAVSEMVMIQVARLTHAGMVRRRNSRFSGSTVSGWRTNATS